MQTELTNARVQVQIAESHGEADLARARKQAEQTVVCRRKPMRRQAANWPAAARRKKIAQVGLSEAAVLLRRIASFRDPKLYAISLLAEQLSKSTQPLVPQRVFVSGSGGGGTNGNGHGPVVEPAAGLFGTLISLLVAEKSGFSMEKADPCLADAEAFADRITKKAMSAIESGKLETEKCEQSKLAVQ